jgi:ferredoxin-NADP reductase
MIHTNNDKSVKTWVKRLFNNIDEKHLRPHAKSYYAHSYHGITGAEDVPFKTLFSPQQNAEYHVRVIRPSQLSGKNSPALNDSLNQSSVRFNDKLTSVDTSSNALYKIVNIIQETPDTKTFRLIGNQNQAFDYLPGQYLTLSVDIAGKSYKRSYSLASSPTRSGIYEITVKRSPTGGMVSNWLNDQVTVGSKLHFKGPFGQFTCGAGSPPHKILLLAAGSGIVPIMSMLRWLTDQEIQSDIMLVLSFRTEADIIYRDELKLIAARHPNVNIFITLTKPVATITTQDYLSGRVNAGMLIKHITDIAHRTVYLCGPDAFMAACKIDLQKLNVSAQNIHCESFSIAKQVATDSTELTRKSTGHYQIRFSRSGKTIPANGQLTLLELAELTNIKLTHECRNGECGECMVKCISGQVEMTADAQIDASDRRKGWVYSCCAYPTSNIVLDA